MRAGMILLAHDLEVERYFAVLKEDERSYLPLMAERDVGFEQSRLQCC